MPQRNTVTNYTTQVREGRNKIADMGNAATQTQLSVASFTDAPPLVGLERRQDPGVHQTVDIRKLLDGLIDPTWAFSALCAAVELGLLEHLDSARTPTELASSCGLGEDLTSALLDVLASIGLARRDDLSLRGDA